MTSQETHDHLKLSLWMTEEGPQQDVVVSTRIRLARNLASIPFPVVAQEPELDEVLSRVKEAHHRSAMVEIAPMQWIGLAPLEVIELRMLVEKHLISPQLAQDSEHGAVILSDDESISIMVNEEDHLRVQVLVPGLQLKYAWQTADQLDEALESALDLAFHDQLGYLTSCPTNVGTGIRASVMMHLPALVMTQQMNSMIQTITQVGLAVRGLYGEGSEATGNLYQISNQLTLGQTEEEIIHHLENVVQQIAEHEKMARSSLLHNMRISLYDRLRRSYGTLCHAHVVSSKEAAEKLSDIRLGLDLGIIEQPPRCNMNELLVVTQPGFLQKRYGDTLTPSQRDIVRAKLLREAMVPRGDA